MFLVYVQFADGDIFALGWKKINKNHLADWEEDTVDASCQRYSNSREHRPTTGPIICNTTETRCCFSECICKMSGNAPPQIHKFLYDLSWGN